jgi:hypothetical protein
MAIDKTKIELIEMIKECDSLEELSVVLCSNNKIILGVLEDISNN